MLVLWVFITASLTIGGRLVVKLMPTGFGAVSFILCIVTNWGRSAMPCDGKLGSARGLPPIRHHLAGEEVQGVLDLLRGVDAGGE